MTVSPVIPVPGNLEELRSKVELVIFSSHTRMTVTYTIAIRTVTLEQILNV